MNGILTFVSSKYKPVFTSPLEVTFVARPQIGATFFFVSDNEVCGTSTVRGIDSENPDMYVLTTNNSVYRLEVLR